MKKGRKKYIGIILILALVLVSTIAFKIVNRDKIEEDPELLTARRYDQVAEGDEAITGTDYVTFDAYYLRDLDGDGYAEKIRGTCKEIGQSDTLYMDLNVLTNGTLKNGKITINGKNFYFKTALVKDSVLSTDYINDNTKELVLNDVASGTQKLMFGTVYSGSENTGDLPIIIGNDPNNYTVTDNTITLTGTHVADDGTETAISKTVTFTNDWYGTASAYVGESKQEYNIDTAIDETNQKVTVSFNLRAQEQDKKLILAKNYIEAEMPLLNGYEPTNLSVENITEDEMTYDSATRKLTITKEAVTDSTGKVTTSLTRHTSYKVTLEYPYEAYEIVGEKLITFDVPVTAYYTAFNNDGTDFRNPYKTNVAEGTINVIYREYIPIEASTNIDVSLTSKISKELPLNIYNNVNTDVVKKDTYITRWSAYISAADAGKALKLEETVSDAFIEGTTSATMENYVKNTGIYFYDVGSLLGDEGWVDVYNDETDELIHRFTKDDWSLYTESNPYTYETGIKKIRVETSNSVVNGSITIYSIKEIDDVLLTAQMPKEEFDTYTGIRSFLTGYLVSGEESTIVSSEKYTAEYIAPYSLATAHLSKSYITTQETNKNIKLNIRSKTDVFNAKKWQNGEFLIRYPEEIIDVNVNSVTASDSRIKITGVDTYESEGYTYTKIFTSNTTELEVGLTLDLDLTADPSKSSVNRYIDIYYYNQACDNYNTGIKDIYDVDNDGSIEDKVGCVSTQLQILAPENLIASQIASDYNNAGTVAIAPQLAYISKVQGIKTATVNLNLMNNYSSTISQLKIVGKIPFEGNTYQLNGSDLGSEFDTTMTEAGIAVPEELAQYATIYYSYNEKATEDLNAKKNGWTTTPADMSQVKSYLIDLGDYAMAVGSKQVFSYTVNIPDSNYNETSYSAYAVYYCLDTAEGKLATQTEPNRLGLVIADKFDLNIQNNVLGSDKIIVGSVFSIQEVGQDVAKTDITDSTGLATIKDLFVEKEYEIKQIKVDKNYVLMGETIKKIIGHVVDGSLQIEVVDTEETLNVNPAADVNSNPTVDLLVENEIKYNFELDKTNLETSEVIQGIRFLLEGNDGTSKEYTTDSTGKLNIKLLSPNIQYTLTETESKGHYLKDPVSFMMVRDENLNLNFNVLSGELDTLPVIDESGEIPVVKTGLANEEIPKYTLRITNKEKGQENLVVGTQFKVTGEGKSDYTLYTTDSNGMVQIDGLYEYVEGKDITGEYTIDQIYPGEGYVLNSEDVIFKGYRDATDNFVFEILSGTIRETIEDVQINTTNPENPIVDITIDNSPVFTLTKIDAETGLPLEGVEFEITNMDGDFVRDANGKLVGLNELAKLEFSSSGTYPWKQNDDGIWQSGNYQVNSSSSTLTSSEFVVEDTAKVLIEWSVCSQGSNYDYLYYTIKNVDTNTTIGGTSTKIGGYSYGTVYDNLKFLEKEAIISEPGRYTISFTYYKNSSTSTYLDSAYLKNVIVYDGDTTVKTDENGQIRLSLVEGLYKATETKTLEGYALPELYTGIGIEASKEAKYGWTEEWISSETGYNYNCIEKIEDGYLVIATNKILKYDFDGNAIWKTKALENSYSRIHILDDGFLALGGAITKFDFEGNILWSVDQGLGTFEIVDDFILSVSSYCLKKYDFSGKLLAMSESINSMNSNEPAIVPLEDEIRVYSSSYMFTFDYDMNLISTVTSPDIYLNKAIQLEDGFIATTSRAKLYKLGIDGTTVIWEKTYKSRYGAQWNYKDIIQLSDGYMLITGGMMQKVDLEGNELWQTEITDMANDGGYNYYVYGYTDMLLNDENSLVVVSSQGRIEKMDLDGNRIWRNTENFYYIFKSVTSVPGGAIAVTRNGKLVKYDLNGNLLWTNFEKEYYHFYDVLTVDDGVIVTSSKGLLKYDFDGNLLWENNETGFNEYADSTIIEDGIIIVEPISSYGQTEITKFDLEGNFVWQNTISSFRANTVIGIENGFIAAGNAGKVTRFDNDGNQVWQNTEKSSYGYSSSISLDDSVVVRDNSNLVKYDLDGNVVADITSENSSSNPGIVKLNDKIVTFDNNMVTTYDWELNLIGNVTVTKSQSWEPVLVEDGAIIAIGDNSTNITKFHDYITEPEIPSAKNVIVENEIKRLKITTSVNGFGGTISGVDDEVYEEVRWKENSTKAITLTPIAGYQVKEVTVNGKAITYVTNADGTVTLDQFTEITEDKAIVATFEVQRNTLTINKTDSSNGNPLANATFNIKELETRDEPSSELIIGEPVATGEYYYYADVNVNYNDKLGTLTNNNDTYYFIDNGNGGYESNNAAVASTTANSYITVDLSEYEGKYAVTVNANVSSASGDYGYATITTTETAPTVSSSTGRFIYITGTGTTVTTATDYTTILDGGKIYYLHFGYYKNASTDSGDDKFTINSVNLYGTYAENYYFVDNGNGGYESNSSGTGTTVARSYIPLDLTNYEGRYNLNINASLSAYAYNSASVYLSERTANPNTTMDTLILSMRGTTKATDYTTVLEGGKIYYVHLIYNKLYSYVTGDDKFTINSMDLTLNTSDFVDEDIVTNSEGIANIELDEGRYQITEVEAPEGYSLNEEQIVTDIVDGQDATFDITNDLQVDIIVHHYLKDTTTSVAPDETIKGDIGKEYSTSPRIDLANYQLVQNEDGTYQLPDNASGTVTDTPQEVIYYYELKPLKLVVHHKLYGTEDSLADDVVTYGVSGDTYEASPLTTLGAQYELVTEATIGQTSGTFESSSVEVTYYYKLKSYNITTAVNGDGGTISGQDQEVYETVQYNYSSTKDIVITPNEKYQIKSITINDVEQSLPEDKTQAYTLPAITNIAEDKNITVIFEIQTMNFTVNKTWVDDSDALSKRPESVEIQLYNGSKLVTSKIAKAAIVEDIQFSQMATTNPWSQNEDGTWQSGNYNINKSTSVLTSDVFEVTETKNLNFEWSVSSEGSSYDYVYYTITNVDTNTTIGGTSTRIGGSTYGTVYESLTFDSKSISLEPGNYKIAFTYRKDSSTHRYLDRAYVRNVKLGDEPVDKNSWVVVFEDVPMYDDGGNIVNYAVNVKEVNSNDLYMYDSVITSVDEYNAEIVSTFSIPDETKDIVVTNNWVDESNAGGKRPSQVTLQLKNGDTVLQEQLLDTTGDQQTYTFSGLSVYDENGNEIAYTVDIAEVNADDLKFYSKAIDNTTYTITNTFAIPEDKVEITVTTNWADNDNENNVRPTQITLKAMNGDTLVQDKVVDVTADNTQTYTFTDLPKYDENGNEITYTIAQEDVTGYDEVIEGTTITNTIKSYNVTVNENPEGGTISEVTETVTHGGSTTQDVIVTPDEGYQISKITVNGEEQTLPENKTQSYTLPQITNVTEDVEIVVEFEKIQYTITVDGNTENGTISETEEVVDYNGDSTKDIVITPNEGYQIGKITINGEEQELPENPKEAYTLPKFTNVTENKEVVVEFEKIPYTIKVTSSAEGGTVSEAEEIVNHGEDSTKDIIITPDEGYEISSITINGENHEFTPNEDGTYTLPKFTNVTEDKEVVVTFEYSVTSVLVKYVTEDGTEIVDSVTIDGKVGDEYTTEAKEFDIYELIETPTNATGTMTKDQIVVTYEYRLATGNLKVEVMDENDNSMKLSGVVIKLEKLDENGDVDSTFTAVEQTTDTNGQIDFGELVVGSYQLTEIQAAEGYDLNTEASVIEIAKNDDITVTFEKLPKLVLPKTGNINYTIVISAIGVSLMIVALGIKKLKKA